MSSICPMLSLDRLPIELLHQIFHYLHPEETILSFYNLNTYINQIINTYDKYHFNFQFITMTNFFLTLHRIHPWQIISLTLSNTEDTPGQFHLFLSLFALKEFFRLQSLQLIQPTNSIDFNQILTDLNTLPSLQSLAIIHCQPSSVNQQTFTIFSSFLNQSISLRRLYLSGTLNSLFEHFFISSINHLYFNDNIFNTISLQTIATRMPHLKSLETAITSRINLLSLMHLTRLTLTIFIQMSSSDMKILFQPMSSLLDLKLIANGKQWFNGHFWEESLPLNLRIFQFNFCTQVIHLHEDMIIETFQTPFWIEDKQWYVMLDYQMNPTMIHLYSLPYCDTQFYYRPTMDPKRNFRSSVPINKPYLNKVGKLTVDLSTLLTESNLPFSSPHYFSNLSTLVLSDSACHTSVEPFFQFLKTIIDLNGIGELKLGHFHHPDLITILYHQMPRLNSLRITETMLSNIKMLNFRRIHSLTISDCLTNVKQMCLMFPNVKHLCVKLMTFEQMRQLMELLGKNLINVTFRHLNHNLQEQFIKWLEQSYSGHRRFSYDIDEHMNLHLWLCDITI